MTVSDGSVPRPRGRGSGAGSAPF